MDQQEFLDFINYIKHNKQILNYEELYKNFSTLIATYNLYDDLELIVQIIEIDDNIEPESLIQIILNLKNKITKNILVSKTDYDLTNTLRDIFINEYFNIKFLPKNITLNINKNENLINIENIYTNEIGKKFNINFKQIFFNDYNYKKIININSNINGYKIKGFVLLKLLDTCIYYNITKKYYGDVELFYKNNSIFIDIDNENSLSDIIKHFEQQFKKKYKNDFYELVKYFKLFTMNDILFDFLKEYISLIKTKYIENTYDNEKINIKEIINDDDIKILKCEHEQKLNKFIKTNKPNIEILNDFLNDEIQIIGSMIFCKWCNQKINYLNFEELLDDKLIIINYEIFKLDPYVNYINLKIYLEEFIYNILNIFKIDFYDYITILAISIINWLTILSVNRLKYETEYINDIKNDYIFFSRLTQEFFSFNIREDISYLNKRILFTNIYLIFHLLLELNINDFWFFINNNYKTNQKHYNDFVFYIMNIFIKKLDIALETHVNLNIFIKRVIEIIVELLPPILKNTYSIRCDDFIKIIDTIKRKNIINYTKNYIKKNIFSIDDNLYNININIESHSPLKLKEKEMIKMTNKLLKKDNTEYIYITIDKIYYKDKIFNEIIQLYDELSFFYKYKNEIYEVEVMKINDQYCIYDKTNYKEKKFFIMFKTPKYLNLTYKIKSTSDMFLFFNINNKFIFLKKYNIEESNAIINSFLLNLEIIIHKKIIINNIKYPLLLNEMINFFLNVYEKLCDLKLIDKNNIKVYINSLNGIFYKNGNTNN